jgi:hypothetical protein
MWMVAALTAIILEMGIGDWDGKQAILLPAFSQQ